jgi:hypothetical protein
MTTLDKKIELIAKVCHDTNKGFCKAIGDTSQKSWDKAPDNIKQSAIDGVKFHLANPRVSPKQTHDNWKKFKVEDGWVYGEVKDAEKKTHPCIVSFDKLPLEQKAKDYIFKAIVQSLDEALPY